MTEQLDLFVASDSNETQENEKEIKLTPRQWATYRLIKRLSVLGVEITQRDIVDNYPSSEFKDGYVWNDNPRVHDRCCTIWSDINKINAENGIHKVIIWDSNYHYKIAETEQEIKDFCNGLYKQPAMAKLWRYGNLMRKAKRNGQGKLIFNDKSSAREYWETFINEHINDYVEELVNLSLGECDEKAND